MTTRLYMAETVRRNPTAQLPTNLGDVVLPVGFGMRYGQDADIVVNTLVTDQMVGEVTQETMFGTRTSYQAINATVASGESATLYMIAENRGADGSVKLEVTEGDQVLASKYISVESGSFVVVTIEVPLEGAGEHTLTVGGNTIVITVV